MSQITKDWFDYLGILSDIIFQSEMLDVCTSEESESYYNARDELSIKLQEITKRFKELLGKEYWDADEKNKMRPKKSIEQILSGKK